MPPRSPSLPRLRGVSRFEFAIVVALLGLLLAVALPRLQAPLAAARQARLQQLVATARATAALFHGQCEALAASPGRCDPVLLSGVPVAGVHGWPAASADGIAMALNLSGPTADIHWQPEQIDGVPALRGRLGPAGTAGACEFIYAQAASPGAAPRIELIDASCP